jgi:hypothetical protein
MNLKEWIMSNRSQNQERWKQRIEDWKQSDQSQVAFCKEQGVNHSTFGYWYAKLNSQKPQGESGFIELKAPAAQATHSVELKLAGGASVCWQVKDFKELAYQLHAMSLL